MTNAHFIREFYNTTQVTCILTYIETKINFTLPKTSLSRADLHVGNRRKGVQGATYIVCDIMWASKLCHAQNVAPCTPFRLFSTCKSALIDAVLRNVKFTLCKICCIVKLPDEVYVSQTKLVGENKSFYNSKSSQTCCSLVFLLCKNKQKTI